MKMTRLNSWLIIPAMTVVVLFGSSCSREYSESDDRHPYFMKKYGSSTNEGFGFIYACNDGHLFAGGWISTDTTQYFLDMDFDQYGKITKSSTEEFLYPSTFGSRLSDGTFILGNRVYEWFRRYDANGKLMSEYSDFGIPPYYWRTRPYLLQNGHIGFGASDGMTSGNSSSFLVELDENLNFYDAQYVSDADLDGKVLQVMYDENDGNFLSFSGNMFRNPWTFSSPIIAFNVRYDLNNPANSVINYIPPLDSSKNSYVVDRVILGDGATVQLLSSGFYYLTSASGRGGSYFELISWSKDRKVLNWRKSYEMGFSNVSPYSMTINDKGEFLVVGSLRNGLGDTQYPFAMSIDRNGNVLEKKVFYNLFDATFRYGYQAANGDCFFSGEMELFGKKSDGTDGIILKTDANFDFQN